MLAPVKSMSSREFLRCFSTLGCPGLTLNGVAALAAEFGIDTLEIRALENRIDLPDYFAAPNRIEESKKLLADRGLSVRSFGSSFRLSDPAEPQRAELLRFAALAESFGTPYIRVFSGGEWGRPLLDEMVRTCAETIRWWREQKRAAGWNTDILIETHDSFSGTEPFLRLFDALGSGANLIWDTHHTWKLGGESPSYTWKHLGPFTKHIHVKDSVSTPSAKHPYTYVLPGQGQMPIAEVMKLLRRDHYTGAVSLEWEKMWHPYLPPLADALHSVRDSKWW